MTTGATIARSAPVATRPSVTARMVAVPIVILVLLIGALGSLSFATDQQTTQTQKQAQKKTKKQQPQLPPLPSGPTGPVPQVPLDSIAPVPPQVSYVNGQLTIVAPNSTLGDILKAVRKQTGADIDVPDAKERVVTHLGPGPARDVIADLLNGSRFNYVMLGSPENGNALTRVMLVAKTGPDNPVAQASGQPSPRHPGEMAQQAQEATPDAEEPEDTADENNNDQPPPPAEAEQQPAAAPDQAAPKTPQQLLQEMQQRQLQMQQQQQQQPGQPPAPQAQPPQQQ